MSATELANNGAPSLDSPDDVRSALAGLGQLSPLDAKGAEAVYVVIRQLYEHDHFERACSFLQILVSLQPGEARYWFAWGMCLKRLERYEEAVTVLQAAAFLGHDDGQTSLQIAECQLRSGAPANADQTLADLVERCSDQTQAGEAVRRAMALRRLLAKGTGRAEA